MSGLYYRLDGRTMVPCSVLEWAHWFEHTDRQVRLDTIGEAKLSTVATGLDHNFFGGRPLLFETMIFGGQWDGFCARWSTWDVAETKHEWIFEALSKGLSPLEDEEPKG